MVYKASSIEMRIHQGRATAPSGYTISFPDMGECKGIGETSVPHTGKYEVFVRIPSPDPFDPYLDEFTPPSDYLPTKRTQYKVFHNDCVDTVSIDPNEGEFKSLGVFVFDTTARVELISNGVEFWRCVKKKKSPSSGVITDLPKLRKEYHETRKGPEIPIADEKRMGILEDFIHVLESVKSSDELVDTLQSILGVDENSGGCLLMPKKSKPILTAWPAIFL